MTGDRTENPTRHHSSARLSALERHDSGFELTDNAAKVRNLGSHHPNSACSLKETRATGDGLWVTELLDQLDKERDALRVKPKSVLASHDYKTPQSVQAKAVGNRQAGAGKLSIEQGSESCSGSAEGRATVHSPMPSPLSVWPDNRSPTWPYALCGIAALTLMGGVAVFSELRLHRGATDTTTGQTAHSPIGAPLPKHSAGLKKTRDIPVSETAAVLTPNGTVRTDASPNSALSLNGNVIELATIVGSPAVSTAALAPGPARMSLPQGQTVRIVAPPKPVITDTRPPVDVTARSAGDEEGAAPDPSRGSVRLKASRNANSYHAADIAAQGETPGDVARAKERPKAARPRRRADIVSHSSKLRREAGPTLPHVAKADQPRSFALPALLRPTSH